MGDWSNGLCGCFSNCTLCLVTCLVPCMVIGKTAEAVDKSCVMCCLASMVPILNILCFLQIRGDVREKQNIDGSCCGDLLYFLFCPFCSVVQTANEVGVFS
ncbi:uncharacterized protein LOC135810675 [Sycon ciliatum]|uniref:uncharacterized protein LOC135810675 n=1 Tax=Sycon ciliatum TaxID=27933 RepID=UPI0020ACFE24|eukprot:scpid80966/ scgid13482/ Protein PLANT CADMIUM RESISTANCE 1